MNFQKIFLKQGDFFGEIALLEGGFRTATVKAKSYTELLELNIAEFEIILNKYPEVQRSLKQIVKERLLEQKDFA